MEFASRTIPKKPRVTRILKRKSKPWNKTFVFNYKNIFKDMKIGNKSNSELYQIQNVLETAKEIT